MPRIESSSSTSGTGVSIPFKVIVLAGLIACGIGYVVYQYEQLHPAPSKPSVAKQTPQQIKNKVIEKLALSDEQRDKLAQLERTTTDPQQLRRGAMKMLTDAQKTKLKDMREEALAKRSEEKAKRQERMNKYFPGNQRQIAEAKQKELQARTAARRAAAKGADNNSLKP